MDVIEIEIGGQRRFYAEPFPLVVSPAAPACELGEVTDWIAADGDRLAQRAREVGVVLFRGFPVVTDVDFDAFVAAFGFANFPYRESLSNAVRVNRTERVFTANEAPPEVQIFLHHEMAQTPIFPSKLLFHCERPAEGGGATPVCRSDVLFERLVETAPAFARECEEKGLRYTNIMPAANDFASGMGRSWQSTLRAESREDAEARLAELHYSWEWLADDCLRVTTPVLSAVRELPSGRKAFFNQLIAASRGWKDSRNDPTRAITFGDGTPLCGDDVGTAVRLADELTVDLEWQHCDVALVDNFVVMHGRRNFSGTRSVLASLVA